MDTYIAPDPDPACVCTVDGAHGPEAVCLDCAPSLRSGDPFECHAHDTNPAWRAILARAGESAPTIGR